MSETFSITVTVAPRPGQRLMAPTGLSTPYALCDGVQVRGARYDTVAEATTGQPVLVMTCGDDPVALRYAFMAGALAYPQEMFAPRETRFTRAADALIDEARSLASGDGDTATVIARAVADKFTYGHPVERYYDGRADIPHLGCGLTEGSCVDINTYLVASFRAAGIAAGYVTGYFFPAEKRDRCSDMHCWVVTREDGQTREWDIAHFLKMGTREITAGLNPKPGFRAAIAHSMGLDFPDFGIAEAKLMCEPVWLSDGGFVPADVQIRLHHPGRIGAE